MTVKKGGSALTRATADRLYKEVQERIREINADPTEPMCITEGLVFGSYINDPGKERPNDLDIAITVKARYADDIEKSHEMQYGRWNELIEAHPSYSSMPFAHYACEQDVRVRIKKGSKHIQLTDISNDWEIISADVFQYFDVGDIARD